MQAKGFAWGSAAGSATFFFLLRSWKLAAVAAADAEAVPMGQDNKASCTFTRFIEETTRAQGPRQSSAETVVAAAVAVCVVVAAAICFYFMRSALKNAVNVADAGLQTAQTGTCRLGECLTAPKRQTGRQQQQQWRSEQQQQHATKQTAAEAKK